MQSNIQIPFIDKNQKIKYTNIKLLKNFITEQGRIIPRHVTCVTVQQQKRIAKALKRAQILELFPKNNKKFIIK